MPGGAGHFFVDNGIKKEFFLSEHFKFFYLSAARRRQQQTTCQLLATITIKAKDFACSKYNKIPLSLNLSLWFCALA